MKIGFPRCALLAVTGLVLSLGAARADMLRPPGSPDEVISGVPVIESSNLLAIDGKKISLWGVSTLAPDQQCWQNGTAWDCGEQATLVLRHFVEDHMLECHVKNKTGEEPMSAQCFRQFHDEKEDVASLLVRKGWALSAPAGTLTPPYLEDEKKAHSEKSGIWGSHFQTAEDWREGIQRYVDEDNKNPPAKEK